MSNPKTQSDTDAKPNASAPNTRWWESYLVRYFVGFIVGGVCVVVLANELGGTDWLAKQLSSDGKFKPDWSALLIGLALLGLGYCYIASTPITVLHAGRYGSGPIDGQSRYFWLGWVLATICSVAMPNWPKWQSATWMVLFVIAVALLLLATRFSQRVTQKTDLLQSSVVQTEILLPLTNALKPRKMAEIKLSEVALNAIAWTGAILSAVHVVAAFGGIESNSFNVSLLVFGAPVVWIGLAQYAVLFRLLQDEKANFAFYSHLMHARRLRNANDVRDTYTHLREHSNSVFIVLVELCALALLVVLVQGTVDAKVGTGYRQFVQFALCGLGLWMVPTVFLWSRANAMERKFAFEPSCFLRDPHDTKEAAIARRETSARQQTCAQ